MNHLVFFISTLVLISLIYHLVLKFFADSQKKRFEKWFMFFIISSGTFVINYYAFRGLSEIEETEYSIAYPIGITVLMYLFRGVYYIFLAPSNSFLSTEEPPEGLETFPTRIYKKVKESDADKIAIYPRITIHDIEIEEQLNNDRMKIIELSDGVRELYKTKQIIFDSSDFVVINKTFGAFDNMQECFSAGAEFKFRDEKLLAEKVQVDFMSIYDDYAGGIFAKLGFNRHTDTYEGKDTPYHIQIIVYARRIKEVF